MKRLLHTSFILLLTGTLSAVNAQDTYFTEYFDDAAAAQVTGTTANAPTTPTSYELTSGTWTFYYAFRAGGGCTPNGENSLAPKAIRIVKNNATTPSGLVPPAFLSTSALNYGVGTVTWKNAKTSSGTSGITVSKSTNGGNTWTQLTPNPVPTTDVGCDTYTITVNDGFANRIRFENNSGSDQDLDNITITSFVPILPVKFTNFSAVESSAKVKLNFSTALEVNTNRFAIERSGNGKDFAEAASLTASQASTYNWIDNAPLSGTNYYRIKAIGKDGTVEYTGIVKVTIGKKGSYFVVAPNPVRGGSMHIQLTNFDKGAYNIYLINTQGQKVFSGRLNHTGGSGSQTIQLPGSTPKGMYSLQMVSDGKTISKNIVVE